MQGYSNAGVVCPKGIEVSLLGPEVTGFLSNAKIFRGSPCASWFSSRNDSHGYVTDWVEEDQMWIVWYFAGVSLVKS